MSKIKFALILLIIFIIANMFGCESSNKNGLPNNYDDILQAAAYIVPDLTDTTTNIISGTISFTSAPPAKTELPATTAETTESIEYTELTETVESSETSEPHESPESYVITPSGKKYHYPTCRTAQNIKQYISKEEAERLGYEPCKICKPE